MNKKLLNKEKWKISIRVNVKVILVLLGISLLLSLMSEIGFFIILLIPTTIFLFSSIVATKYLIERDFKPRLVPYLIVFLPLTILSLVLVGIDFLVETTYHEFLLLGIASLWLPPVALIIHFVIRVLLIRRYKS